MNKSWLSADRTSSKYDEGVNYFLEFASKHATHPNFLLCPCTKCGNLRCLDTNTVKDHLYIQGVMENYTSWVWHGERCPSSTNEDAAMYDFDYYDGPTFSKIIEDVYMEYEKKPDAFIRLLSDAEKPLFSGCRKYMKLSSLVCLFNLKTKHGRSDNNFFELLFLLKDTLPDRNEIPPSMYEAKKKSHDSRYGL